MKTDETQSRHALEQLAPLTEWPNEPSVLDLKHDLQIAQPAHEVAVAKIMQWRKLRAAESPVKPDANGKLPKNRSTVQPKLVRRNNEWRYAPLSEPFLSAENVFKISGRTWEDKKSASQNALLINWQVQTKLNWTAFIDAYVRAAVDDGTVIVRPGWRRETVIEVKDVPVWKYEQISDPQQAEVLQQAMGLMESNPQEFDLLPEELQESALASSEHGMALSASVLEYQQEKVEKVVRNHPTLDVLDFENVYIDPNCEGDIDKANFGVISFETSKAELQRDGRYVNLEMVNWSSNSPLLEANHTTRTENGLDFKDEARKRVVAYEYWGFYDIAGDGILVPIVATWIGSTMIRMERNPYPDQKIPLVLVQYMPVRKSIAGESDAELLEDNQNILGAVTRGMIDLMGKSANSQTGIARGMLDVPNRRRFDNGQDYEFNPSLHPTAGFHTHTFPEISGSAMNMLAMQNHEAESLTGVKAFSGGLAGNAYGDVAAGIRGILDAASKREMAILRRMAKGVEDIGRKLIAMNSIFLTEEEVVQVTNEQYVTILRDDLAGEHDLKVDIATAEVDEAKAQDLGFLLQTLGNTVPWEITREILAEIADLKRMPTLAHAIRNFTPQPDPLAQKKAELEIAKLEAEIAEEQAKAELSRARAQEAMAQARALSSNADLRDLDFLEQESGTKHLRDMDKIGGQAQANQRLELTKGQIAATLQRQKERTAA